MNKRLPIGISDFREIIEHDYYFVDKSLFIRDVIEGPKIALISRPRRFGKTLNLSMLRYFFSNHTDFSSLFEQLAIQQGGPLVQSKMGRHPVVFLSFKDIKAHNWKDAYTQIRALIREVLTDEYRYLMDWEGLNPATRNQFRAIESDKKDGIHYASFLKTISKTLHRFHQQPAVILIDEYDTPVYSAYVHGYLDEMLAFMRDLLSGGLKDNSSLEKGVITGIMRVAKESIFSGLNNLDEFSVLTHRMSAHFGFLEKEVEALVRHKQLPATAMEEIRNWYNGYVMGEHIIYNPWSILKYTDKPEDGFKPYWINTSANLLLKRLFFTGKANIRIELEQLIRGEKLRKEIIENLILKELDYKKQAVWSLLLASGYLKAENMQQDPSTGVRTYDISIPNKEVHYAYRQLIDSWLTEQSGSEEISYMLQALTQGETKRFAHFLKHFVSTVFSFHDTAGPEPERFYHAFLLGLLVWLEPRYHIRSNRESGQGRFDIALTPKDPRQKGIIIEIKSPYLDKGKSLEDAVEEAAQQMLRLHYAREMQQQGITDIVQLAIAIQGKEVLVKEVPLTPPQEKPGPESS
ncbi:MAG: AAA family ATPase [Bacteroidetes bacterium]|nr:MAG: AAA family ATPase [Bacteroidota bacterium]